MIKYSPIIFFLLFSATLLADGTDVDIAAGKMIYNSYCAQACHQAPAANRLRPKQWRVVLNTMQKRMRSSGMSPLTDIELENVYAYLTQPAALDEKNESQQ